MARDQTSDIPAQVAIRFRTRRCAGDPSNLIALFYTSTVTLAQAGFSFSGISNTTKWFHDTALGLISPPGTDPTNKSTLDTLALQIAKDYYKWLSVSFDEAFAEIDAPIPDGLTDLIEWTYSPNLCSTRRMTRHYNADPEELYHHDPQNVNCKDSGSLVVSQEPCIIYYGPPVQCVSGQLQLTRYKVCLTDGLLMQTYVSTDTISS